MQTIKPRARQVVAYRGELDQWEYWHVHGCGFSASGVDLNFTLARWYAELFRQQTDPVALAS
jgi:hypothetical protein